MFNFFLGVILGIVVATIGFSGIASTLDKGVDTIKTMSGKPEPKEAK
jgi:hypothetical protein